MGPRRTLALAAAGLASGLLAAPAVGGSGPVLNTSGLCYDGHETVRFAAGGFKPRARWRAHVGARLVDSGRVSSQGGLDGSFTAPSPRRRPGVVHFTLSVTDGKRTARRRLGATRFGADYRPSVKRPRTRVRFLVAGFPPRADVFLHYVTPRRRLRRTVLLGRSQGACGTLVTRLRPVFPFAPTRGRWRLQFDTHRRYRAGATPRARLVLTLGGR